MSLKFSITQYTQLIDIKTGLPTRDLFQLLAYLNSVAADVGALVVEDSITNGVTTKAPSENAVFDALATRDATIAALVEDAITNGVTTKAPSENAVFDALALKLDAATAATTYLPLAGGTLTGPLVLPSYTVAGVPAAASNTRGIIYVSNETGGATIAFSDGTDWRRVQDRAVIS